MSDQEPTEAAESTGRGAPGWRRTSKVRPPSSEIFSRPEPPAIISTEHRPPAAKPTPWRTEQIAERQAAEFERQAVEAKEKADKIKRYYRTQEYKLDDLQRLIEDTSKTLGKLRQTLQQLASEKLKNNFEETFWKYNQDPFDRHALDQFLKAGILRANAGDLRALLTAKIKQAESEISLAETEKTKIETELEAATKSTAA